MKKVQVANTMGILLSLDEVHWKELMNLSEPALNQMYRNYNKNALSTNHMGDELIALRREVLELKRKLQEYERNPTQNYVKKCKRC